MCNCKGSSVMAGVAIGPLHFYQRPARCYNMTPCDDPAAELARMEQARRREIENQSILYKKALEEAGAEIAAVFDVHALMLDDSEFVETVRENIIAHHMRAEYAVRCAAYAMMDRFAEVDDEYMRARMDDVLDMARGVIYLLQGSEETAAWDEPAIVVTEDLLPSEAVRLDKKKVLGLVTYRGSTISHASILARSMELPALVRADELDPAYEGHMAILDGVSGELIVDPDVDMLLKYRQIQQEFAHRRKLLHRLKGKPNETIDGHRVEVLASVSKEEDLELARDNDAGGIGHFRSDYLFVGKAVAPTEEEQYQSYKRLAQSCYPNPVRIATIDWGSEEGSYVLSLLQDEAMAKLQRGIRRSLMDVSRFKVQLRAVLRAAALGNVQLMMPMVTSVGEVQRAKEVLEECRQELLQEGKAIGELKLGLQIETPAAVWMADELAQMVDFFVVCSNDLIQYTCVLDRDSVDVVPFADLYHPAVLRAIAEVVRAGHRHGISVSMAGELGADTALTEHFLRMGIDSFSVVPTMILPLRNCIRHLDLREPASPVPVWQKEHRL